MPSKGFNPSLLSSYGDWSVSKFNHAQNNLLAVLMYFGLEVILKRHANLPKISLISFK